MLFLNTRCAPALFGQLGPLAQYVQLRFCLFGLLLRGHKLFVEGKRSGFDQLDQLRQRLVCVLSYVDRIVVTARIFFKIVEVENLVGEIRFDQHVDVEIDVTQNTPIETRRQTDVAVEVLKRAGGIAEPKNVVPAIEPVVFDTDRSTRDRS